ncbi:hypothetical protein PFISCL1PPCAC_27540 [Pristionchus fissidentatus]|uniref:SAP domain-containing protein n=1 Tax=Pristionchus fissidentatus TaxID=1538716 RepID=A0AAV5WY35_9BILA|nr:hypothetical protein PFISCL1PPCAC_27540 [Pristionchus fissidentatus]
MSTKIAPAPPPLPQGLPRIAFLPNSTPVLLIPSSGGANRLTAVPIRVAPANERTKTTILVQKRPTTDEITQSEEAGDNLPSTQQRREYLKRKIQERPSKQFLLRQHILHADPRVEPFVGEKTHQLRKQAVVSNLNRKLKSRPGPLDLVTKKILQADAELEEAIKEGRLLFPSSRRELESPSPSIPQAPSPSVLLSSLRISKQVASQPAETIKEENEPRSSHQSESDMMEGDEPEDHRARKYGRVERPQQHPYARVDTQPSPSKGRLKGPETKSGVEYTAIPDNFEAMMKQQELFIEWRRRPEGGEGGGGHTQVARHSSHPIEDGGESDSGETIPYGDDDDSNNSYRHFPELPAENADSIQTNVTTKITTVQRQPSYRTPIYSLSDIKKTDLMQECRLRGMKCGGDKTSIIQRLDSVKEEIISKFKEEQARIEATIDNSPQISSERALSNTSSSSSPSTIIEEMVYENGSVARIDESLTSRRHSLPSSNNQMGISRSTIPPTRHLSMSSSSSSQDPTIPSISSLSFTPSSQLIQSAQNERKIQMKTANGEIFYATLPSAEELPIPRDGKPIGCRIAIVNGKPVLQFQQPSGPIEPGSVGAAGIRDTLLFASNGSGGQVTLGPQKERVRSSSLHRKVAFSGDCSSISSLLRANPSHSSLPVVVQRANQSRSLSTSSTTSSVSNKGAPKTLLQLPKESRKPSKSPPQPPPREVSVQPEEEEVVEEEEVEENMRGLTDAQQVFAHVKAINHLLDRHGRLTLDAKTVLEHEHALRSQQRIIDQLGKELKKSHTALKMQQQLIQSAKRAQSAEIAKMTNNKLQSIGEAWLFELNMKRLHKSNANFFLTHEQQMQELQGMTEEQKRIQKTHASIQISEASDSAIKDISKFIGANPKTALLIVQLLKKYQNEKNQSISQQSQTFGDIPAFEPSEKTPISSRPPVDSRTGVDFTMNKPGTSKRIEAIIHDKNANDDRSTEAIVIDDDSQDEEIPQKHGRINLAEPPMRNRRKDIRGNNIKVDMEEIFRTVLDGSKNSIGSTVTQPIGSPADTNQNKTSIRNSPTHSISSIHSTHSSGLKPSPLGVASTSASPSSSSTPPESSTIHHSMSQPTLLYHNNNHVGDLNPLVEYGTSHSSSFSSDGHRPYVREEVTTEDNPTDILMEAVESSGIVDESPEVIDEPMPSTSHCMMTLEMNHDNLEMGHDHQEMGHDHQEMGHSHQEMVHDLHEMTYDHQQMSHDNTGLIDHGEMGNDLFDDILNESLFHDFDDAFKDADYRLDDSDFNDLIDVISADAPHEKRSPDSKKVSYNGTEELNKILGPSWMNMNEAAAHEMQMHHLQMDSLDLPSTSTHQHSFEDVFASSSSHVGGSLSTSSRPPHSPMITDMSWLNEEEVRAALSPQGAHFPDLNFDFSPSNA